MEANTSPSSTALSCRILSCSSLLISALLIPFIIQHHDSQKILCPVLPLWSLFLISMPRGLTLHWHLLVPTPKRPAGVDTQTGTHTEREPLPSCLAACPCDRLFLTCRFNVSMRQRDRHSLHPEVCLSRCLSSHPLLCERLYPLTRPNHALHTSTHLYPQAVPRKISSPASALFEKAKTSLSLILSSI